MVVHIRPGTASEANQLTALARRAKAHWGYPTSWLKAWEPQLTIEPEYLNRHRVLVAEVGDCLVGMCALEDRGRAWQIEHVWVEPRQIGHGVGRALVEQALALAREIHGGPILAEADPNAAGFYRRLGARDVAVAAAPMPGEPDRVLPVFEFPILSNRDDG